MKRSLSAWTGAGAGYLAFLLGGAAASLERGAPTASAPGTEIAAFFSQYRSELLAQSLLFVLAAGVYLWFFSWLRGYLIAREGGPGTLSTLALTAGSVWAALQMVLQSGQAGLALSSDVMLDPALAAVVSDTIYALSVIAYVPMAVMLGALAVVSLRTAALPRWVSWLSALTAVAHLAMSLGVAVDSGPFVPGGTLTYVLYALLPMWLLAVTSSVIWRMRKERVASVTQAAPAGLVR